MEHYHTLAREAGFKNFFWAASHFLKIRLETVKNTLNMDDVDYVVNSLHLAIHENPAMIPRSDVPGIN